MRVCALVTGAILLRGTRRFLPYRWPYTVIASTRCAYPQRDGQAEFTWVAGYILR